MKDVKTIDEYIALRPREVQVKLQEIRTTIKQIAPHASEKISYGLATFYLNGNLVHFGAFKDHIGFFPTSSGVKAFEDELKEYKTSKGTIQLPLDKPLQLGLIARIVKFRLQENLKKE